MIIESGFIVAAGLLLTFWKCSWQVRMWVLSRPLFMDILVFSGLNAMHWGSFSGVMVAATGALICSALLSIGRKCFGHIDRRVYFPGIWTVPVEELR
jgi:hypothetical protein